jgi:uncharacterized protein
MNDTLKRKLINTAREEITTTDPSHDLNHSLNVLGNALMIAEKEGGDLDVIVPAALFHDLVNIPKEDPDSKFASQKSADKAVDLLKSFPEYQQQEMLDQIREAIASCSFSNRKESGLLEAKIIQDADALESTGAISILRTFASVGLMEAKLYNLDDPFCEERQPESIKYGLDLFYSRLLRVSERMNTATARLIAEQKTKFLEDFLKQLNLEIYR